MELLRTLLVYIFIYILLREIVVGCSCIVVARRLLNAPASLLAI